MIDLSPKTSFFIGIKGDDTRYLTEERYKCVKVDYWSLKCSSYFSSLLPNAVTDRLKKYPNGLNILACYVGLR